MKLQLFSSSHIPRKMLQRNSEFWERFRGYDYQFEGQTALVWKTIVCLECLEPLALSKQHIHCPDEVILRISGLNKWTGKVPELARATYDNGPLLCKTHYIEWFCNAPLPHLTNLLGAYPQHG